MEPLDYRHIVDVKAKNYDEAAEALINAMGNLVHIGETNMDLEIHTGVDWDKAKVGTEAQKRAKEFLKAHRKELLRLSGH